MVMADASRTDPAPSPAATEKTLTDSLNRPAPQAAVLTEEEAAFFTALGRRVTDAATAYDGYVRHAEAIDPGFRDPASVQRAVRAGADYQPQQLQQGIVAYAAMIALRSPAFVEGVRARAQAEVVPELPVVDVVSATMTGLRVRRDFVAVEAALARASRSRMKPRSRMT